MNSVQYQAVVVRENGPLDERAMLRQSASKYKARNAVQTPCVPVPPPTLLPARSPRPMLPSRA
eukprot:3223000-Rhodomonas_salina.1